MKRVLIGSVLGALALTALAILPAETASAATSIPKAVNGQRVELTLTMMLNRLKVATENRTGYERTKFKHWNDVDRDCQNARAEVLRAESRVRTNSGCYISSGSWFSAYDGVTFSSASSLDIDHMIPLAEAWDSGARSWGAGRRQAFANDLTYSRSLIAVSASSNRSKGDRDPKDWLPDRGLCTYIQNWVAVKMRWTLSVNPGEKAVLYDWAHNRCSSTVVVTYKADVKYVVYDDSTSDGGGSGGSGCTPGYSPCLPPMSDYDCAGGAGNGPGYADGPIYVTGSDPYDLDSDGDGVACER